MSNSTDQTLRTAIRDAGPPPADDITAQGPWNRFGARLSGELAQAFADALRPDFPSILPKADRSGRESRSHSAKGMKRLDVNYSTPSHGLGLGVSIKTINKRDRKTGNFRHNFSRVDNELRAEAMDYHRRQPYSVLVAVLFLPFGACEDGRGDEASSFGLAVKYFRSRNHRQAPADAPDFFEQFYVALYRSSGKQHGESVFFDVNEPPPRHGPPSGDRALRFSDVISRVRDSYWHRNRPPFLFADGRP